jgi:hypothetical protein
MTSHRKESNMLRIALRCGIVTVALAVPLVAACVDYHTAEQCELLGSCPYDAGDGGDATVDATDGGDN